ncbi:MAG: ATP-binding protein, partial [Lachnospiraceae bacterium]
IIGDELRIVQVLNNLISNAYKFSSVGSIHVEVVKTAQTGSRMELFFMVIDTGIGIDKADQDKLFKSFSQVDASISRKYGGTGLGLNICKQLVELMGGNIHVKSEAGKGTMFSFNIWVETSEQGTEGTAQKNETENTAGEYDSKRQVLLNKLEHLNNEGVSDKMWKFGEAENLHELEKKMSKLILAVEMENWEKAEMFAETVKQLLEEAPSEVRSAALRLKMAVQKGDYEKTAAAFDKLKKMVLLT